MSPAKALIVFDFDDTLCPTGRYMEEAFAASLLDHLKPYRPELTLEKMIMQNHELHVRYGSTPHGWMHELGQDMAFTLDMFEKYAPILKGAVAPHMQANPALLRRLQELQNMGHTLAILTLGHRDYCLPIMEKVGLSAFFPPEMVFDISVMEGRLKREPSTFLHLLKHHLQGNWRHKYMFEDSAANLIAAHKAGFHTILIGPHRPPEELHAAINHQAPTAAQGIDYLIDHMLPL